MLTCSMYITLDGLHSRWYCTVETRDCPFSHDRVSVSDTSVSYQNTQWFWHYANGKRAKVINYTTIGIDGTIGIDREDHINFKISYTQVPHRDRELQALFLNKTFAVRSGRIEFPIHVLGGRIPFLLGSKHTS